MLLPDTVLNETDETVVNRRTSLNRGSAARGSEARGSAARGFAAGGSADQREPVLRADLTLLPWMRTVAQVFETADRMLARSAAHNARHAIHLERARRRDWADEAQTWLALSDTGS